MVKFVDVAAECAFDTSNNRMPSRTLLGCADDNR